VTKQEAGGMIWRRVIILVLLCLLAQLGILGGPDGLFRILSYMSFMAAGYTYARILDADNLKQRLDKEESEKEPPQ
jgi:hypothetical protein